MNNTSNLSKDVLVNNKIDELVDKSKMELESYFLSFTHYIYYLSEDFWADIFLPLIKRETTWTKDEIIEYILPVIKKQLTEDIDSKGIPYLESLADQYIDNKLPFHNEYIEKIINVYVNKIIELLVKQLDL